ncbi:cyclase [Mycolicibacterium confluentis]|uniref:Cyclase n=1 Tax=Mycolicibacterium confluentis TaxID=28047 RepID=A0A7I7XRK0_9MYCO|nr:cyclase [Mycolicibacterium confluentis]
MSHTEAAGEHKQVTVLFCDVVGSMQLAARLDPEELRYLMHNLFNRSAAVVQRYGGTVDKFTGDGLMALFGAPIALEDHATRACIAALQIQTVAKELAAEVRERDGVDLRLRIGLNSGAVVAGEIGSGPESYTAIGQAVGMAQRMESAAPADGVLCSESTAVLAQGAAQLGPVQHVAIKGETELVPARQLLSVSTERPIVGRDEGPMVGRAGQLAQLMGAFEAEKGCLVEIMGAPGLGKSRLIGEFAAFAGEQGADVVIGRCDAHTADVPLWALARMLRAMFGIARLDDDAARAQVLHRLPASIADDAAGVGILFELLGIAVGDSPAVGLNLDARRRWLVETMLKAVEFRPLRTLFILEDLHWIDAASDATLTDFASTISATESMLVVSYRPEYRGTIRDLAEVAVTLEPLDEAMTLEIARGLIGSDVSLAGVAELVSAAASGNPFFVEEIVRDLVGRNVLTGSRGSYRGEGHVDEIAVPATIQAVLASRIDRLSTEGKAILNAAAVIGSRFELRWLNALLPHVDQGQLAELVSVELIDQIEFVPDARYAFRHPLVRTVAYESQLTDVRTHAHRRVAEAIEAANETNPDEVAALIGAHLEAAGDLERAYGWHMRAAEWLQSRDIIAARSSWTHARDLADQMPADVDLRQMLQTAPRAMLAWTEWMLGCDPESESNYRELRELAAQSGDTRSQMIGIAGRMTALCTNYGRPMEAVNLAADLLEMIDTVPTDVTAKVDLLFTVMWAQFMACDYPATQQTATRLRTVAGDLVSSATARAYAVAGLTHLVTGDDPDQGRRDLQVGLQQARTLDPATYAMVMAFNCGLVAVGVESATSSTLHAAEEALLEAEQFGDNFGIICGLWAYALMVLRLDPSASGLAVRLLERARAVIAKHRTAVITAGPIEADLAIATARNGDLDGAIELIRDEIGRQFENANFTFVGLTASTLVQVLAARGREEDIDEATMLTAGLRAVAQQTELLALDNCVLLNELILADAAGDADAFRTAFTARKAVLEKLNAQGEFMLLRPLEPPGTE